MLQRALRGEPDDDAAVGEPAILRAVEIDDVQPVRAERAITQQQLVRLEVVTRLRVEVALEQPHATAAAQIDGGNEDHGCSGSCFQEIGEDARADHARTLGVKLRAAEIVAARDRGEVAAVVRGGDRPVARRARRSCARSTRSRARSRRRAADRACVWVELVPAHVRHRQAGRELQLARRCPGITPRPLAGPSSECSNRICMPRQMPNKGCLSVGNQLVEAGAAQAAMASCAEPTPGSSTRGARWMTP